jgi:hypothetical protein
MRRLVIGVILVASAVAACAIAACGGDTTGTQVCTHPDGGTGGSTCVTVTQPGSPAAGGW